MNGKENTKRMGTDRQVPKEWVSWWQADPSNCNWRPLLAPDNTRRLICPQTPLCTTSIPDCWQVCISQKHKQIKRCQTPLLFQRVGTFSQFGVDVLLKDILSICKHYHEQPQFQAVVRFVFPNVAKGITD